MPRALGSKPPTSVFCPKLPALLSSGVTEPGIAGHALESEVSRILPAYLPTDKSHTCTYWLHQSESDIRTFFSLVPVCYFSVGSELRQRKGRQAGVRWG